jgi:hypothetical protein
LKGARYLLKGGSAAGGRAAMSGLNAVAELQRFMAFLNAG